MQFTRLMILVVACLLWTAPSFAVQPNEVLPDAALEKRARELSLGLRCLVCQNQSIDDSDAPLAKDLRVLVRERLKAGDSDAAVVDYVVQRYGDYVLLKPPFRMSTLMLWLAPLFLLLGGIGFMWRSRRAVVTSAAQLSADEQAKLDAILKN